MNLIKEINAFYKLDMPGQLSFSAQSLYMALLHTSNEVYSRDITPSNPLLMAKTGIRDVKTLDKARLELVAANLIDYKSNSKFRLAGEYHIIGLNHLLVDNFRKNTGEIPEDTQEKFLGSSGKKPLHIQEENIGEENNIPLSLFPQDEIPVKPRPRKARRLTVPFSQDFEDFWKEYPRDAGKLRAFRKWNIQIKEGHLPRDMIDAAKCYAQECKRLKTEEQYIKHASTFLGPDKPFIEYFNKSKVVNIHGGGEERVIPYRG